MSAVATERSLDEILELSEPHRTNALREWVEDDEPAKIKAIKAPFEVTIRDKDNNPKTYKFTPSGRRVRRDVAVHLLQTYGKKGKYRSIDRKTGMTESALNSIVSRDDESTKYWQRRGMPTFEHKDNYLYHAVDEDSEEDEE